MKVTNYKSTQISSGWADGHFCVIINKSSLLLCSGLKKEYLRFCKLNKFTSSFFCLYHVINKDCIPLSKNCGATKNIPQAVPLKSDHHKVNIHLYRIYYTASLLLSLKSIDSEFEVQGHSGFDNGDKIA